MSDRLYRLKNEPAVFETGVAQGKQVLISADVNEISVHWFAPNGEFLERIQSPRHCKPRCNNKLQRGFFMEKARSPSRAP